MNFLVQVGSLLLLTGTQVSAHIKQDHVLPVFGCGTGCRVETEQLSNPEIMDDGWIRVKVIQRVWVSYPNKKGVMRVVLCTEPESRCTPVQKKWLFADCAGKQFASGSNADRSDASTEDIFYREGPLAGEPKYQSVAGNPFMKWAKLCPVESAEEMDFFKDFPQKFFDFHKMQKTK